MLEDSQNHYWLKFLIFLPLFLAVLLLVDGLLPEIIEEQKEFYIYGNTGSGRYSDNGKYLKTPNQKLTINDEVYYDLDHLQPVLFIKTPLLGTIKSLIYKSREQPNTSYKYQGLFSVYGFHSLWIWLLLITSCVTLFATHVKFIDYGFTLSWALAIVLFLAIFINQKSLFEGN